ncbi:hypothetical protein KKI24_26810 [bacterium]|nr:hypothetical protein [bacterium]
MKENRTPGSAGYQSRQFRCVKCGFQTTSGMFDKATMDIGIDIYSCPDCGSKEIIDFDTRRQVNQTG